MYSGEIHPGIVDMVEVRYFSTHQQIEIYIIQSNLDGDKYEISNTSIYSSKAEFLKVMEKEFDEVVANEDKN
jgi:hypothetical protein